LLHRYRTALLLLVTLLALPARADEPLSGSFEPLNWRRQTPWDDLWSTRWSEGIYYSERLSLRSLRGGYVDQVGVDPKLGLLVATRQLQDISILPPRYYTTAEYAHDGLEMQFARAWRAETLRTLKGDPSLAGQRRAQGGLLNLDLPFELPGFAASVFGEGAPNLRISGSERITIGGTSNWRSPLVLTEGRRRSLFPTLEMRQELNVRLNGTIGDKLHIDINQNSEASTSLENQIKIYYQGYDDDVIQRVDLGNTNLTLPRSTYVSASTRQEGLFGVKMTGRLASWDFAVIASKQEGQADVATFAGGSQETRIGGIDGQINDIDFERRRYYFLSDPDSLPGYVVDAPDLEVFVSTRNPEGDRWNGRETFNAILSVNADSTDTLIVRDTVVRLTPNDDYYFVTSDRTIFPVIVLRNTLANEYRLGVSFRYSVANAEPPPPVGNFFTTRSPGDPLVLKMIKPAWDDIKGDDLLASPWAPTRRLEAKNVYSLGARDVDLATLNLRIRNGKSNSRPSTLGEYDYLEICGLDLINNVTGFGLDREGVAANQKGPDGLIDRQYIDDRAGILFFPDLRPFDPGTVDLNGGPFRAPSRREFRRKALGYRTVGQGPQTTYERLPPEEASAEVNPNLYDKRDVKDQYRQYFMDGTFRAFATEINLNRPGILENSETVRMDSDVLVRGVDYNITYETGQVRLISDRATNPNGNLQITYSYTPLFTQGNRSLMGFSTTYGGSPDFDLSTTFLYETKGSNETRPRLQQEPSKTILADISGSWRTRPWVLTRMADALPIVSTNAPSNLSFTGAVGVSLPNPNTKNNVYVDDMEGSIQTNSAGVSREAWQFSSRPVEGNLRDIDRLGALWFSVQRQVQREDLSPDLTGLESDDFLSALGIILTPNPNIPEGGRSWVGLTHVISPSGLDLSEAQYLEIWVNDFNRFHGINAHEGDKRFLRIDIGSVSEDAVWDPRTPPDPANGRLDNEDLDTDGQRSFEEDIGLDGLSSVGELAQRIRPDSTQYSPSTPTDPAGDDYSFTADPDDHAGTIADRIARFRHLNGTESNQRLDTENLDNGSALDQLNDYLELTFELGSDEFTEIDVQRDYPGSSLASDNGWRLLRIPLNHPSVRRVGLPDLNTVKHMRLWFDGFSDTTEFQIVSIDIVGNRWERQPIRSASGAVIPDSTQFMDRKVFNVATVDNKQNVDDYTPPFEPRKIDRVTELERSLNLQIENLDPGEEVSAFRPLVRDEDYTLYQVIQFYLQLREDASSFGSDSLEYFLRFSSTANADTVNSYEVYRTLDRANEWQSFDLPITELSSLKVGIPAGALAVADSVVVDTMISNGWRARIYGQPSFSQLRRLQVGLRNIGSQRIAKREVWFNELRLGEVRRDNGLAGRGAVSFNMGDLATVSTAIDRRNADFLTLGQSRGNGISTQSLTFSSTANLDKLTPGANLQLPLSFDYRNSRNVPKFRANNDIVFDGDGSGLDITQTSSRAVNLSVRRLSNQYTPWIVRNTIDALSLRFGANRTYNRATTSIDSSQGVSAGATWGMHIANPIGLPLPGRWKLTVFPENVSTSYTVQEQKSVNYVRDAADPDNPRKLRETKLKNEGLGFQSSWRPLPPVTFTLTSQRDLSDLNFSRFVIDDGTNYRPALKIGGIDLGREVSRSERLTFSQSLNLTSFFRPRLSWTGEYNENHGAEITTSTDIANADNPDTGRVVPPDLKNVENRSSTQVSWTIPMAALFRKLATPGKAAVKTPPPAGGADATPDAMKPPLTLPPQVVTPIPDNRPAAGDSTQPGLGNGSGLDTLGVGGIPSNEISAGGATGEPPATPVPTDPRMIEKQKKAAEEAAKEEAERLRKEDDQRRKDAVAEAKRQAEDEKRAREDAERDRKKEAERLKEMKKKEDSRGGIGGQKRKNDPPAADSTTTPGTVDRSDDTVAAGAAPDTTALPPGVSPTEAGVKPTPPGALSRARTEEEARRRTEDAERKAEEERRRREAEAERARKAAAPPPTLGSVLFRDLIQIGDIRTNFNLSDRNSANRVHGSPSIPFRLGLSDQLDGVEQADNSTVSSTVTKSASGNSAVTFLRDIAVDANFQYTESEQENNRAVSRSSSTIWPGLRMNLNSLEKKLHLTRFFTSFTASSGYEKRSEEQGTASNPRERVTSTSSWRPLLQFDANWRNGVRTQFSADHSSTISESNTGGQTTAGLVTTRTSDAYRLTLAKSLNMRSGGRGGVRNTIDLNFDFTYNKDSTLNDYVSSTDVRNRTDNLQGRFSTSYRFTTNVSGSMQLNYTQRRDLQARTADRTLGLQATAAITF